jgi:hypothetical protein
MLNDNNVAASSSSVKNARGKKGKKGGGKRPSHNPLSSDLPLGVAPSITLGEGTFGVEPIVIEKEDTEVNSKQL